MKSLSFQTPRFFVSVWIRTHNTFHRAKVCKFEIFWPSNNFHTDFKIFKAFEAYSGLKSVMVYFANVGNKRKNVRCNAFHLRHHGFLFPFELEPVILFTGPRYLNMKFSTYRTFSVAQTSRVSKPSKSIQVWKFPYFVTPTVVECEMESLLSQTPRFLFLFEFEPKNPFTVPRFLNMKFSDHIIYSVAQTSRVSKSSKHIQV